VEKYFFDTYAIVSLVKNNPDYIRYSEEIVITTLFNLVELYYIVLKDFNEEKAKIIYNKFKDCIYEVKDDIIFEAMKLKLKNKSLSYVDAIGYIFAIKNNLRFLTGDKEFKDMPHVEFVK